VLCGTITKKTVTVVEANKNLKELLTQQGKLNQVKIKFVNACVVENDFVKTHINFYLHNELWFSSTKKIQKKSVKVRVPTQNIEQLLQAHRPTVLMVDIEGREEGVLRKLPKTKPRLIIVEIHSPLMGPKRSKTLVRDLMKQGYKILERSGWTYVFCLC
jgi:FkbM family methyltransferase